MAKPATAVANAQQPTEAQAPRTTPPKIPFVTASQVQASDLVWTTWQHVAPAEYSVEDVLNPQYFRARVENLQPGHTIEVRHSEWRFWLKLLVVVVDKVSKTVRTHVLQRADLPGPQQVKLDPALLRVDEVRDISGTRFIVRYGRQAVGTFASRAQADEYVAKQAAA